MDQEEREKLCPRVQAAFELLGRKWTGLILHQLLEGECSFSDLERTVPSLSSRMLALRIKELEAAGLVHRTVVGGPPIRVSYRLTEKGRALEPAMRGIEEWAQAWT